MNEYFKWFPDVCYQTKSKKIYTINQLFSHFKILFLLFFFFMCIALFSAIFGIFHVQHTYPLILHMYRTFFFPIDEIVFVYFQLQQNNNNNNNNGITKILIINVRKMNVLLFWFFFVYSPFPAFVIVPEMEASELTVNDFWFFFVSVSLF